MHKDKQNGWSEVEQHTEIKEYTTIVHMPCRTDIQLT